MQVLFLTLTNIGDVILSTALLNRILADHPQAVVDVICGPRAVSLFEGCRNVRRVIPFRKQSYKRHHLQLLKLGWAQKYDLVVDLRTPIWGYLARASQRIMGAKRRATWLGDHYHHLWPSTQPLKTSVWPAPQTQRNMQQWLQQRRQGQGPVVVLCPTTNWAGKAWPLGHWQQLTQHILDADGQVIVVAAPNERPQLQGLFDHFPAGRVCDASFTSLTEAAALCQQATACVANDSGLAHLAAATGQPTIVLFGPMDEAVYRPIGPQVTVLTAPTVSPADNPFPPHLKPRPLGGLLPAAVWAALQPLLSTAKKVA